MIKAVFLDFFNTLAYYQPSREDIYINICSEHGIHVEPKALAQSLPSADMFWRDENRRSPVDKRTQEEQAAFYSEYVIRVIRGAGAEISRELALEILLKLQKMSWKFTIYDDVLTTLKLLKDRNLILGLISNVGQDMEETLNDLGIQPYLDFNVTSFEAGCDKPQPEIFLAALQKARVKPEEAVYVGDQYDMDVTGARGVGMESILLDRNDWFSNITDCPRIQSLAEIVKYI